MPIRPCKACVCACTVCMSSFIDFTMSALLVSATLATLNASAMLFSPAPIARIPSAFSALSRALLPV
ncbi:hypothetical protein PF005_g26136 [Phytophthora fragariae]|uniref:Uncharacterized protein n=1 Tax=Phytophthora fragariae TaxID=53985 RepID=A0A6A3RCP4_9STRA|nr:hypothetical protein PF006_g24387 [Phytophthora fragariae]KAE9173768.1 hypothetical protein PF005_g26136 [Phytophthora fragariae]